MQHHLHETKRPTATPATHKSYLSVSLCSKFHVLFDFCNHIWLLHSLRESHIFLIFFVGHPVHICVRNVSKHVTFSFFCPTHYIYPTHMHTLHHDNAIWSMTNSAWVQICICTGSTPFSTKKSAHHCHTHNSMPRAVQLAATLPPQNHP